MKTLLTAALVNAIIATTAFAGGNAERFSRDTDQDFTFKGRRGSVPDDYVRELCVTCPSVHLVSPANRELSGDRDE
jgi:hypothetical protein